VIRKFVLVLLLFGIGFGIRADVRLPAIFSDNMVLQNGKAVPVWGWADKEEKVTVSFSGQEKSATAGDDGKWMVKLDTMKASSEPQTMTISSSKISPITKSPNLQITNILVGEVWLCSGQSNMEMGVGGSRNANKEMKSSQYPGLRLFKVQHNPQAVPQDECQGSWKVCSPNTVGQFSATAYFFGREIHQRMNTPVGLIDSSWGGTLIEAWTSLDALSTMDEFKGISAFLRKPMKAEWNEAAVSAKYEKELSAWKEASAKPGAKKTGAPRKATLPRLNKNVPANLYNGMIHPLIPYSIRGAIWYQGEGNAFLSHANIYSLQLATLLRDWRNRWGDEFPFAWVQLPEFLVTNEIGSRNWPVIREEMLKALNIPHTGMAVGLGLGDAADIHPKDKQGIGKRLALWALAEVYAQKDFAYRGPLPAGQTINGSEIVVSFKHTDGGLIAKEGGLKGFKIAGENMVWVDAQARISGETVVLSSPDVPKPVAVRYAWADNPEWSLLNGAGLPAAPFRTDTAAIAAPAAPARTNVPEAVVQDLNKADVVMDGTLNEAVWKDLPEYSLRDLVTGNTPVSKTTFKAFWAGDALYLGIRCEDIAPGNLNIGTTMNGDSNLWNGDVLEVMIETQAHSYYQWAVNPAGAMVCLDRSAGIVTDGISTLWSSDAKAVAHADDHGWSLEMRIPVRAEDKSGIDPLNGVLGRRPTETQPWYFNICRQRVRDEGAELSAFSPTGINSFHELVKFGKLYVK
jgi:hypothetical protein